MDMGAASTSNHHQGYRNESHKATQSQTAHIDCRASKYESLRSSQRRRGGRRGFWHEKLWKSTRIKKEALLQRPGISYSGSKWEDGRDVLI